MRALIRKLTGIASAPGGRAASRAASGQLRPVQRATALFVAATVLLAAAAAQASPPQRIVSLAPNLTAMVIALGSEERLAAVTPFCAAAESVPRLPGGLQPEAETVLGFSPDLILTSPLTPEATRQQLKKLGLRVEVMDTSSLTAIRGTMDRIAGLLELPARTPAPPAIADRGLSCALLFGADTGYSAGRGTHAHEILEAAGLHNIATDRGSPWPELGEEFLLAADPDIILVADYAGTSEDAVLAQLRAHPVRRHLTAVRRGRVLVFPAAAFSIPGPEALAAPGLITARLDTP